MILFTGVETVFGFFFRSKAKSLYIPFMVATVFYFVLQVFLGIPADPFKLISQVSMLNIFDGLNSIYNWSSLWFIPYLLLFMLVFCLLEKYVKNTKIQLILVLVLWFSTILLWVFDTPIRLGELFNEFLLVFMFGFFVNKLKMYQKIMRYKMVFFAIPLVAFFSVNFSNLFTYNNQVEALKALLYFNVRIIVFSLPLVLLALLFLKKVKIHENGFIKFVASKSAFIYLSEPFISYVILRVVFGQSEIYFADNLLFYIYQVTRVVVLLVLLPLVFMAGKKLYQKRASAHFTALSR
jgi:hypothetical protein